MTAGLTDFSCLSLINDPNTFAFGINGFILNKKDEGEGKSSFLMCMIVKRTKQETATPANLTCLKQAATRFEGNMFLQSKRADDRLV